MKLNKNHYLLFLLWFTLLSIGESYCQIVSYNDVLKIEKERVLKAAEKYLNERPITLTMYKAERSTGGLHDYFSEGDYWWPNPEDPSGPYIRKDGLSNPENYEKHRLALRRFSIHTAALTSAYLITKDKKYSDHALLHLKAWFINEETKMNPNMLYSQAIKGRFTGRGIGIIDAIHLIDVVRSLMVLEKENLINNDDLVRMKNWFKNILNWMTTNKYGIEERSNGNNHSIWWAAQVSIYAKFVNDIEQIKFCTEFFKDTLLPKQMSDNGSFPEELKRTKPYNYSLFNLEGMSLICEVLSDKNDDLWNYKTKDGRSVKIAFEFMFPFIEDKSKWRYQKDVANFDQLPVRLQGLLFSSISYKEKKYFDLWKKLTPDYYDEELLRNYPIRQPLLWIK